MLRLHRQLWPQGENNVCQRNKLTLSMLSALSFSKLKDIVRRLCEAVQPCKMLFYDNDYERLPPTRTLRALGVVILQLKGIAVRGGPVKMSAFALILLPISMI